MNERPLFLGHITVARDGLSMQHLEDLLSTDEDVLHSVYQWWGGRCSKLNSHSADPWRERAASVISTFVKQ